MSFQLFVKDVCAEPLTVSRLEEVWKNCNLANKSPLIDPLLRGLHKQLEVKAQKEGVPIADVSIVAGDVQKMCDKFTNGLIMSKIPPRDPMLETVPGNLYGIGEGWKINPATSIVFKPHRLGEKDIWVAIKVVAGPKVYDLETKHINICISNGWYFHTNKEHINCPFKVKV